MPPISQPESKKPAAQTVKPYSSPGAVARPPSPKKMAATEQHLAVAELYLRGKGQWQIAQELGMTSAEVISSINTVRDVWMEWIGDSYDRRLVREIAKLDRLEAEMWDAWDRSKRDAERRTEEEDIEDQPKKQGQGSGKKRRRKVETEGQCGDTRYVEMAYKCIDTRLRLLGAFKEKDKDVNVFFGQWDKLMEPSEITDPIAGELARLPAPKGAYSPEVIDAPPPKPNGHKRNGA